MTLQTMPEFWASRHRALGRHYMNFADNGGAPWHSASCLCQQCLDADALLTGPSALRIEGQVLFARVEA